MWHNGLLQYLDPNKRDEILDSCFSLCIILYNVSHVQILLTVKPVYKDTSSENCLRRPIIYNSVYIIHSALEKHLGNRLISIILVSLEL